MLGLAAASAPQAIAAEGAVDAALPPVPNPTEVAAAILEEAGATSLPAAVAAPLLSELPAAPAQTAAAEPAQVGADAAPPPEPVSEPVPEPEPEPDPEPQPAAPQPDPPVVQQEPANVNVSVRIDSPGDDGAVTQVNVAVDDPPAQYQPEQPQYQPVVPPIDSPARPTPPASPVPDEPPEGPDPGWDWTWNWSCGDAPVGDIAIPFGVETQDWNWNWNWICGEDEPDSENSAEESLQGYQAPVTQYRPVNINVSIRIGSPGDNGPVVQANVAVGVTVPIPVLAPVPAPVDAPATTPAHEAESSPAPQAAGETAQESAASPAADEYDECCVLSAPRGVAYDPVPRPSVVLAARKLGSPGDTTFDERDTVAIAAQLELRARRAAATVSSPPRPQARPARPAPTRPEDDEGQPLAIQGGIDFAPVNGPDRLWPYVVLMLFAFGFASVNISRASARSRPTPGIDADEPPNRPG